MSAIKTVETNLNKYEINTVRAMITYMLTEDTDIDDKFYNKLTLLEEKFNGLASRIN